MGCLGQGRAVCREVGRDPAGGALISRELEEEAAPIGEARRLHGGARDAPGCIALPPPGQRVTGEPRGVDAAAAAAAAAGNGQGARTSVP